MLTACSLAVTQRCQTSRSEPSATSPSRIAPSDDTVCTGYAAPPNTRQTRKRRGAQSCPRQRRSIYAGTTIGHLRHGYEEYGRSEGIHARRRRWPQAQRELAYAIGYWNTKCVSLYTRPDAAQQSRLVGDDHAFPVCHTLPDPFVLNNRSRPANAFAYVHRCQLDLWWLRERAGFVAQSFEPTEPVSIRPGRPEDLHASCNEQHKRATVCWVYQHRVVCGRIS